MQEGKRPSSTSSRLTVLQRKILDGVAAGKTPAQISEEVSISPSKVYQIHNDLINNEVLLDTEQMRKLQAYRLNKLVEALWERTQKYADKDDVKNLMDIIEKINDLLALNIQRDKEELVAITSFQANVYIQALRTLVDAFKALAPGIMSSGEWDEWTAQQLQTARRELQKQQQQQTTEKAIE